jgi:hypothetical protein
MAIPPSPPSVPLKTFGEVLNLLELHFGIDGGCAIDEEIDFAGYN